MKSIYKTTAILVLLVSINMQSHAQSTELWGVTSTGGDNNIGTIFKTDSQGDNHTIVHSFYKTIGLQPQSELCEASNGKLYGMTRHGGLRGGIQDSGVLFEYDPATNKYLIKVNFEGPSNGGYPEGGLIKATNGKLYGMTTRGGKKNLGVLFEYDPANNKYTKKIDFDSINGSRPIGNLMQAANGKLYGMTSLGGANNSGIIFEFDITSNLYTKKIDFDFSSSTGGIPRGSLIQAGNGKLYGLAAGKVKGKLFEYDITSNTLDNKIEFSGNFSPYGTLLEATNGKLYGIAGGGTKEFGVLFEYDPTTNTYSKKIDFDGKSKGSYPEGKLMQAANGKLYGTTFRGGEKSFGVIFEYDPATNKYTKKIDFDSKAKGGNPSGVLMIASNGKLYGMTSSGGGSGHGILYEYVISTNTLSKKIDFGNAEGGVRPNISLIQAANGKLYGTTTSGGKNQSGVLFEYDPGSHLYTKKIDLDQNITGTNITGHLIEASDGKLYGLASNGGQNGSGLLFDFNPLTNTFTKRFDFIENTGAVPQGSLIVADNGKLYGTTSGGGKDGYGVLFEFNPTTYTYTKKIDFNNSAGILHTSSLIAAPNGKLYGVNDRGGPRGEGYIFEYDPKTNIFTEKINFDNSVRRPNSSLIAGPNGKLYGTTQLGRTNKGVLYEYTPDSSLFTVILNFNDIRTSFSYLMLAKNGKLYGIKKEIGGKNNTGLLFEYNLITSNYTKKIDFDGSFDKVDPIGKLIEISDCYTPSASLSTSTTNATITANITGATYQWLDCNNNFSKLTGETGISFTTTTKGTYAVEVTNGKCIDTTTCVTFSSLGITDNTLFRHVSIYPNPTKGMVNINLGELEGVAITVFNTNGQLIYSKKGINAAQFNFKLDVRSGIYVIKIETSNETQNYKLILE